MNYSIVLDMLKDNVCKAKSSKKGPYFASSVANMVNSRI